MRPTREELLLPSTPNVEEMDFSNETRHSIIRPVESDNSLSPRINPPNQNHMMNRVSFGFFSFSYRILSSFTSYFSTCMLSVVSLVTGKNTYNRTRREKKELKLFLQRVHEYLANHFENFMEHKNQQKRSSSPSVARVLHQLHRMFKARERRSIVVRFEEISILFILSKGLDE